MLCEICRTYEATGYIEETKNNTKRRINLCPKCLGEKRKEIFGGGLFSGFVENKNNRVRCLACGRDLKAVINTLFVGCPECYTHLKTNLAPLIKNIQGADSHAVATPLAAENSSKTGGGEIARLQVNLERAVAEERYEDAAQISKRIKQLKGEDAK